MTDRFAIRKCCALIGGLAFFSACKTMNPAVSDSKKADPELSIEPDSTIAFSRSENLTDAEKSLLMQGSKNCFLDSVQVSFSGDQIRIVNGSFETAVLLDRLGGNKSDISSIFPAPPRWMLKSWINVSPFDDESPFDLQPGKFGVRRNAVHGQTFVGMVGRDNATNESMGQILEKPLEVGKMYVWSLFVCRSDRYESISRSTNNAASFTKPLVLRIWGGKKEGRAEQLFAQTGPIDGLGWQKICFILKPKSPCEALFIEAAHSELVSKKPYNGNVLIDAVGPLQEIGLSKN